MAANRARSGRGLKEPRGRECRGEKHGTGGRGRAPLVRKDVFSFPAPARRPAPPAVWGSPCPIRFGSLPGSTHREIDFEVGLWRDPMARGHTDSALRGTRAKNFLCLHRQPECRIVTRLRS